MLFLSIAKCFLCSLACLLPSGTFTRLIVNDSLAHVDPEKKIAMIFSQKLAPPLRQLSSSADIIMTEKESNT